MKDTTLVMTNGKELNVKEKYDSVSDVLRIYPKVNKFIELTTSYERKTMINTNHILYFY